MPPALRLPLRLAAGCAALLAAAGCASVSAAADPPPASLAPDAPDELRELLARYDSEPAGAARDALAARIDRLAHQKYATVSRLYWHTDFAAAQQAARASGKPILHLRMLGRLDEDLSCANSRLFRATLYANREVSAYLRDHFVLHWSSERPVPRVTIDYGDGRKIERTITGNSAHYVLDADGNVLDVLPGVYAPSAFRAELKGGLALAERTRGKTADDRARMIADYHRAEVAAAQAAYPKLIGTPYVPGAAVLLTQEAVETELQIAQRATFSKAAIEISDLAHIAKEMAPDKWPEDQTALWASAGQMLYGIGDLERAPNAGPYTLVRGGRLPPAARAKLPPPPRVLDDQSRALVAQLHDAVPAVRGTKEQTQAMVARLEQHLVADSALNQLRIRPLIAGEIVRHGGRIDFATLNTWVYTYAFRTPKTDPWLGLMPRTDFTGLPGDGVVMH
jgi:hypothetical protein